MTQDYLDLSYLVNCALKNQEANEELISKMNFETLIDLAKKQGVLSMTYYSLSAFASYIDPKLFASMEKIVMHLYTQLMKQDYEREQLLAFMEKAGIQYMPLKGVILKNYYPDPSFREMCDNDILYSIAHQSRLVDYMKQRGYIVHQLNSGAEDVFKKDEITFEMHRVLIAADRDEKWIHYYENVWDRLILDEGSQYGYHFSDEDFYIFILIHAYKHFKEGGMSLRTLTDFYLYLVSHPQLDFTYIDLELEKLGASDFEKLVHKASLKLFNQQIDQLTQEELAFLDTIEKGNTYEDESVGLERKVEEKGKKAYLLRRLFPSMGWYQANHPFIYKSRILIPVYWVYHTLKGIVNGKAIKELFALGGKK